MDYVLLGKRIRIMRVIMEMTQEELAKKIGVCTSLVGHIERGTRRVSVETLYEMCKVLDISADFLIGL